MPIRSMTASPTLICSTPGAKLSDPRGISERLEPTLTQPLEVAAATDPGLVRRSNEDAFGYDVRAGIFVVCDGMGGAAAGEVASRASVDAFLAACKKNRFHWNASSHSSGNGAALGGPAATGTGEAPPAAYDDRVTLLEDAVEAANDAVFSLSEDDPRLRGMGTTLVALLVEGDQAWVAHVGDSRCYRIRQGALQRLTDDHSLVDEQVRRGQMTAEEAERSPLRHVITRAVGSCSSVLAEISEVEVQHGDLLLLCSDGLVRELDDGQIGSVLADAVDLEDACCRLIEAANRNGGRDNVSCLLVRAV